MESFVEHFSATLGVGYNILVYGIGILAMALSVIAFQFPRRVTIIICTCLGQTSWVLYFLLQGDLMSAIACGLSAVMLAVFSQKDKWRWATSLPSILVFLAVLSGFSLLTFAGWIDLFPLAAGVFAVIANSRATEKRLRQFSVLWSLAWLMNSILRMYPVALINDLFCTVSAAVSLLRYRSKPTSEEKNVTEG